jgi:hypothetical protein
VKVVVTILLVLVVTAAIWLALKQRRATHSAQRQLTTDEIEIRNLVREAYGANILSEQIVPQGRDVALVVKLQNEKLEDLKVNLSSMARHHREGASLAALKASLRFD